MCISGCSSVGQPAIGFWLYCSNGFWWIQWVCRWWFWCSFFIAWNIWGYVVSYFISFQCFSILTLSDPHSFIFELLTWWAGLLQQLLSLKLTEPELIKMHGHYLDAMGPFLKYFPDAVGNVISKLFEMLTSLPHIVKVCFCYIFSVLKFIHGHMHMHVYTSNIPLLQCLASSSNWVFLSRVSLAGSSN